MNTYTQLSQQERYQISTLKQAGYNNKDIAAFLGRHKSTISRELGRNNSGGEYQAERAHRLTLKRKRAKIRPRFGGSVWAQVELLLQMDWSPQQISGRLLREEGIHVSHEDIYQYIYADKRQGGDLHKHLRCQKKRRKRYDSYD
jgi:IS30 family transposase